jgi:hypothetical protein
VQWPRAAALLDVIGHSLISRKLCSVWVLAHGVAVLDVQVVDCMWCIPYLPYRGDFYVFWSYCHHWMVYCACWATDEMMIMTVRSMSAGVAMPSGLHGLICSCQTTHSTQHVEQGRVAYAMWWVSLLASLLQLLSLLLH